MKPLEIKKNIIKDILTPFFKNNGFIKKGVKYFKNINHFNIIVDIQSLKYHKIENREEFRVNVEINLDTCGITIGGFSIPSNDSHITIDEKTNIEEVKLNINKDLESLMKCFEKYDNVKEIIEEQIQEIELLEEKIIKTKNELNNETDNQNLIYVLKNSIELYTNNVILIKNWIKSCN